MVSAGTASTAKRRDGGTDEHEALGRDALRDARLHERAEREPGEHDRQRARRSDRARMREHGQRVVGFAVAFVEGCPASAPTPRKLKRTAT